MWIHSVICQNLTKINQSYIVTHLHYWSQSVSVSEIKLCVCVRLCVHLPEAGPVSRTEPASCPWEMHRWPAAAKLERDGGIGRGGQRKTLTKALRINNQPFPPG